MKSALNTSTSTSSIIIKEAPHPTAILPCYLQSSSIISSNQQSPTSLSKKAFKQTLYSCIPFQYKPMHSGDSMLRSLFLPHMALLHWQPMPHQYIIDFWVNLTSHITSLIFMESDFSNKRSYLHKMTTKPKVCHSSS